MQNFSSAGALRFIGASPTEKRRMLSDLATQFRRDRRLRKWDALVTSGERFTFSDGAERYILPVTHDDLGAQIFVYGEAEFSKVLSALRLLGRDRVRQFVDIGANVGQIAIPGLARGIFDFGYAVEPDPTNFGCLAVNAVLNDVAAQLQLVHAAVGSGATDRLHLALASSEFGDHRIATQPGVHGDRRIISVPATTIDTVSPDLIPETDLMWMDIQGYEVTALRGAQAVLASRIPLVMEFWPSGILASGETLNDLMELVGGYGQVADLSNLDFGFLPIETLPRLWSDLSNGSRGRAYVDILLR